jgi:hypothetical protein
MLFGQPITLQSLVGPGLAMTVLIAFQLLTGKRWLKLKGRLHWRLHRFSAYALTVFAVYHGVLGLALAFHWSIF